METIVVAVRDTDVLLLLLAHYDRVGCTRLYTKAGTSIATKYVAVHETRMLLSIDLVGTLLSNHLIERSPAKHPVVVVAGGSPKRPLSSHLIQISKSPL